MAKKKKGSGLLWVVVIVMAFFLLKDKISFGDNDDGGACGSRGVDEDKSGYCLTSYSDYDGMIIITGNTSNTPVPELDFSEGDPYDTLMGVFYNDGPVSIISAAGDNPNISLKRSYKPKKNLNASRNNLEKLAKEINTSIKQSPTSAGADYFGAILKAGNEIRISGLRHPIIMVIGSGYSDRGTLDFAHNEIFDRFSQYGTVESLVGNNRSVKEGLLDGVTVKWYKAGVVAEPQARMSDHYQALTRDIYASLFDYLGAVSTITSDAKTTDYASVESEYTVGQVYVRKLEQGDSFNVNEEIGRFEADKDILLNRDEAKEKLRSFASRYDSGSNLRLSVTGYIAICNHDSTLGLERAVVVKGLLSELGVPEDKIDAYGQPGAPSDNPNEAYTCNSSLPETERRTVKIEVVGSN